MPDVFAQLLARPWEISQREFAAVQAHLAAAVDGTAREGVSFEDIFVERPPAVIDEEAGVAFVHVQGALADKAPPIWEKVGFTDYRSIRREVGAARDAGVERLNLLIDSPGGTVAGSTEAVEAIQAAATQMEVHAHCDGMACSAAYKLAAAADTISATPTSDVGNIGTVLVFADPSEFFAQMGVEVNVMVNEGADLKGTFREPLTDAQREFLQRDLNETGAAFRAHVEGNRAGIDPEVFRAGWYSGERAVELGLVDTITH